MLGNLVIISMSETSPRPLPNGSEMYAPFPILLPERPAHTSQYPKHSSTSYFIPMDWIYGLTLDRFWNEADERLDLLRVPKTFGYRQVSSAPEFRSRAWRRSQSSEILSPDSLGRVARNSALRKQLPDVMWVKKSQQKNATKA